MIMRSLGTLSGAPGQGVLGVVTILFVPGYAFVALLFPSANRGNGFLERSKDDIERESISVVERLVLAVGLSVCLVPLVGLGLGYTPGGIQSNMLLRVIGILTVVLAVAAAVRRLRLPPDGRFDPRSIGDGLGGLIRNEAGRSISTLNVLLIVGLLVAASGIGFAAISTDRGEQFTEFYILTEDPETGELVAGGYPDEVGGEPTSVHVGVTNHEGETKDYTVVVLLQWFEGDEERSVQRQRTLDTFSMTVQPGETRTEAHEINTTDPSVLTSDVTESDLRVTYLLYTDSPPPEERLATDTAYRHTHFWIGEPPSGTD